MVRILMPQCVRHSLPVLLVTLFVVTFFPTAGFTQQSTPETDSLNFIYQNWNNKSGLPQNSVFDITRDKEGFLWGATEDGLFRFDGANFQIINKSTSANITSNAYYDLLSTPEGIWASGRTSLLLIGKQQRREWDMSRRISGGWVKCLERDRAGRIWIGTNTGELFYLEKDSIYALRHWQHAAVNSIESILLYKNQVLIGTTQGLFALSSPGDYPKRIARFDSMAVTTMLKDHTGALWIGTAANGLFHISGDTVHYSTANGLKENYIGSLSMTEADNTLWIGYRSNGYQLLRSDSLISPRQDMVAHDGIRSVYAINEKMIWLGTNSTGLVLVKPGLIGTAPTETKLSDRITLPVYQHPDGDVWVGTAGRGVHHIRNGKTRILNRKDGLSSDLVLSIYGKGDYMYLGTSVGLDRYNRKTGTIDRNYSAAHGLPNNSVIALFTDSKQRLWLSTRLGGLFTLDQDEKFIPVKLPEGIQRSTIISMYEDGNSTVWFGSRGGGMIRITADGSITHFTESTGLPADVIYGFYEDAEDDIWMATEKGLLLYNGKSFMLFDKSSGLFFNEFYRMLEDPDGYLWLSGNYGLQRIAISELLQVKRSRNVDYYLAVRLFNATDGMPNAETNGGFFPAGWAMQDGTIWFPTIQGIAVVDYRNIREENRFMNIHIQHLQLGDKQYFPGESITLPPGVFNFEIQYTSIDFLKAGDIQYFFRLRGMNNDWTAAGNRHQAYFSGLAPGKYIFDVKAERYGVWSPVSSLEFSIQPHFYQTMGFKAGMAGLIVLLLGYILYAQRLRARQKIREQHMVMRAQIKGQEKERQYISTELHDSISQQLATARMFLDLAKNPEDKQQELIQKSEEVVKNVINDIRVLCHSLTPPGLKDIGLEEALEELFRSYRSIGKFSIDLSLSVDPAQLEEDLQFTIFRIIQEQMQNIARHAQATSVSVDFTASGTHLLISIRDDGRGFDPRSVRYGLGFRNIRNRLELYNGKMELRSAPGNGCSLHLTIPVINKDIQIAEVSTEQYN